MRFTFEPVGDLEVPVGATLAESRAGLAALGGTGLASAPLTVDGRELAPDQVAGAEPWLVGALVRVGPGQPDPVARAAGAPWHVAVVRGPDAGAVAVPDHRGALLVGRAPAPPSSGDGPDRPDRAPGHLLLTDPAVSRAHLEVRASRGAGAARWRVHDDGSANGTLLTRPRDTGPRAGRRVHRVPRALHVGDLLTVGGTVLELRQHPPSTDRGRGRTPPLVDRLAPRPVATAAWAVPLVGAGSLLAITRSPVALVLALGALAPVLPGLLAGLRRRRPAAGPVVLADDPAAVAVRLAAGPLPTLRAAAGGRSGPATGTAGRPTEVDAPAVPPAWTELALCGLAVVGPRPVVLAAAHGLLGAALGAAAADGRAVPGGLALTVLHRPEHGGDWAWCRWLGGVPGPGWPRAARDAARVGTVLADPAPPGREGTASVAVTAGAMTHVVVDDSGEPWRTAVHRWWAAGRGPREGALVLEQRAADVPAWCRWVLRVGPGGATLVGPGGPRAVELPIPRAGWIEEQARRVGALAAAGPEVPVAAALPTVVGLGDLGLPHDAAAVRRSWGLDPVTARHRVGLVARIGLGTPGTGTPGGSAPRLPVPVDLDLVADGPHTLVAGTTGAGKSELLQALVLSLALRHPPSELALVLIDFKGGAGLGVCRDLPHVVGEVTDLDPVEAGRALDGLRAELHRRERLLAQHGVADLEQLRCRAPAPPRLVVVVDELRALAEDLPDFVPRLVRVAAQGRSLGIHLVLATQRPAGVVDAQLRANVAIRVCLRVADAADSADVVDAPDAAAIGPDRPGRAVLRCGPGPLRTVQTAWPALRPPAPGGPGLPAAPGHAPGSPGDGRRARVAVRAAVPWDSWGEPDVIDSRTGFAEHLVTAVRSAAQGLEQPGRLWHPPLPTTVRLADVPTAGPGTAPGTGPATQGLPGLGMPSGTPSGPPPALPLGLVDRPERLEQGALQWDPRSGPLLVAGGPRSGRTTTLRTLAAAALERGWHVHAIGGGPSGPLPSGIAAHHGTGTLVGTDDPRRLARLLALLGSAPVRPGAHPGPATLLLVDDLDAVRGALSRLPRGAPLDLLDQAVRAGTRPGLAVAVAGAPTDLVRLLPLAGPRLVLAVADPHDDALLGVPRALAPGRRVPGRGVLVDADAARCQVAIADTPAGRARDDAGPPGSATPLRLAPLPLEASHHAPVRPAPPCGPDGPPVAAVLGPGGDAAEPVRVDLGSGLLVVGPAGSGRSAALATIAAQLPHGSTVVPPGPARAPAALLACLDGAPPGAVLVIDDLDLLVRTHPGLDEHLAGLVLRAETDPSAPRVVAAARTDRAAAAYRGAVASLRTSAPVLVLAPHTPGSADVVGCELWHVVDPARPDHPGRGALVHHGRAIPVQVATVRAAPVLTPSPRGQRAAPPAPVRTPSLRTDLPNPPATGDDAPG